MYVVTPLGDLSGASTESNACNESCGVQLWSYAFLATRGPAGEAAVRAAAPAKNPSGGAPSAAGSSADGGGAASLE